MKCPRRKRYDSNDHGGWDEEFLPCLKGECAWWDQIYERCDPTGLAHKLKRLTDILTLSHRKMPHEVG